jgi:hypothetical protein
MVIGGLFGRTRPEEDESHCLRVSTRYRDQFSQAFGSPICNELRAVKYGSQGEQPCWVLVETATRILLDVLDDAQQPG